MSMLAPSLQAFFVTRLGTERDVSPHTVDSYRHTFRLLLTYTKQRTGKAPSQLEVGDLDAALVSSFLDHLEHDRGCGIGTRNTRLAAVHSFFRFASYRHPEHAATIQQVLAIPQKKTERRPRAFLTTMEMEALLAAPNRSTRSGRRDHMLLALALQTGLRLSELTGLRCRDVELGAGAHVKCLGKGRKRRDTPLDRTTVSLMRAWLGERGGQPDDPLFPSRQGGPPELRRGPAAGHKAHRDSTGFVSIARVQKDHRPQSPPQLRHGPACQWPGHRHGGPMARSRKTRVREPLRPLRSHDEGARTGPALTAQSRSGQISTERRAPRLPRQPLIMPSSPGRAPP